MCQVGEVVTWAIRGGLRWRKARGLLLAVDVTKDVVWPEEELQVVYRIREDSIAIQLCAESHVVYLYWLNQRAVCSVGHSGRLTLLLNGSRIKTWSRKPNARGYVVRISLAGLIEYLRFRRSLGDVVFLLDFPLRPLVSFSSRENTSEGAHLLPSDVGPDLPRACLSAVPPSQSR